MSPKDFDSPPPDVKKQPQQGWWKTASKWLFANQNTEEEQTKQENKPVDGPMSKGTSDPYYDNKVKTLVNEANVEIKKILKSEVEAPETSSKVVDQLKKMIKESEKESNKAKHELEESRQKTRNKGGKRKTRKRRSTRRRRKSRFRKKSRRKSRRSIK